MTSLSTTSQQAAGGAEHGGRTSATYARECENRLVGFALDLVDAPAAAGGMLTSGGAAAALLAVLAAREARPDLERPALVLADTADPAYLRAAGLLGVDATVVASDPSARAPVGPMAHAMDERTVLAVVSAPVATLGVVDPVTWIGTAALAKGVPLHVDARAGGWLQVLGERLGRVVPPWTFAAPGVDSIALDLPTGATTTSLLLLGGTPERRGLTFSSAAGPGAPWVTDACSPTEALAVIGWQAVTETGHDGYLLLAGATLRAIEALTAGVRAIGGLHLLQPPDSAVVLLRTDGTSDVFTLAEELASRGWSFEAQPSWRDLPPTLRIVVDPGTAARIDDMLPALDGAVTAARLRGPGLLPTRVRDHLARLDPTHLSTTDVRTVLDALGLDPATAVGSARFGQLVDAAPGRLRAALVTRHRELLRAPLRG